MVFQLLSNRRLGVSVYSNVLQLSNVVVVLSAVTTSSPAVAERPRDASCLQLASIVQYVERNLLLLVTLASALPLRKLNSVLFSSLLRIH